MLIFPYKNSHISTITHTHAQTHTYMRFIPWCVFNIDSTRRRGEKRRSRSKYEMGEWCARCVENRLRLAMVRTQHTHFPTYTTAVSVRPIYVGLGWWPNAKAKWIMCAAAQPSAPTAYPPILNREYTEPHGSDGNLKMYDTRGGWWWTHEPVSTDNMYSIYSIIYSNNKNHSWPSRAGGALALEPSHPRPTDFMFRGRAAERRGAISTYTMNTYIPTIPM